MNTQALIIGGTTGMGKATADLLLQRGIEVIVVGRPGKDEANLASPSSRNVKKAALDLNNMQDVEVFAAGLQKLVPNLRYLVNAAGYFSPKAFLDHEPTDYDTYHNFNKAFFFITQAAARIVKDNDGGSIVNVGSM